MDYKERYNYWLTDKCFDEDTKKELKSIENDEKEIEDRFYKDLEFGTGGLRGVLGAGPNRMNKYTVTKVTQGIANYIVEKGQQDRGVVIAYDSRHMSTEFSIYTALCFNANGIKTYRFETLRPTPELSFTVRELKAYMGIVLTASHNPKEYNGYKVYSEDGAQITFPLDKELINETNKISDFNEIKTISLEEAKKADLYHEIGKEIDDKYIETLKSLVLNKDAIKQSSDMKIVYTPLHGTGNIPARRILKEIGFNNVEVVKEQELPNGDFPTVDKPNPEDPKAFKLALDYAKEIDADLVLATDPDADRLGIYAKNSKTNEYESFTGNMSAILIAEYRLSQLKEQGKLPKNGAIVTTIVSTNMGKKLAEEYGLHCIETLTGFKYIGEQIKFFERDNSYQYVFGFEESYGSLIGTYARDKDGISAVMALCEAGAYYRTKGMTLCDQMENIYKKYGYYQESLYSVTLKGIEGLKKISSIMEYNAKNPLTTVGGLKVLAIRNYNDSIIKYMDGRTEPTNLPKSNVLYYELENDAWFCMRPSGTEPKIKFYMGVKGKSKEESNNQIQEITKEIENKIMI